MSPICTGRSVEKESFLAYTLETHEHSYHLPTQRYHPRCRLLLDCTGGWFVPEPAVGDDWPGWMGGLRDGVYRETGIIDEVPSGGLKVKWRKPIEGGYAGPAVAAGRVFVFDYQKESGECIQ